MFIVFEGIDGVGKSSHIKGVADFLLKRGVGHVCTSELNNEDVGKHLKYVMMNSELTGEEEIFLINVARAYHARTVLLPAIKAKQWIFMDRFIESTFAYQHGGKQVPYETVEKLSSLVTIPKPDLTILLDGNNHRDSPNNKFDSAGTEFFDRVKSVYNKRFQSDSWVRYNTNKGYKIVQDMIRQELEDRFL